jgi:adenosylhomocysteinase
MPYIIKDISLAESGLRKIAWAAANMPVLNSIAKEFLRTKPFEGLRIAVSVHVEAKTAYLAQVLRMGGADVALTGCNPLSTQDDVAAALASEGMNIYCINGVDNDTYLKHLRQTLSFKPHIVIDDGGDFAQLLHSTDQESGEYLIGGSEETTTGVNRLKILEKNGLLKYPVIAVNDARSKHLFDNRFGTGQSVWTAIMSTTNMLIAGKTVVVAGYGMCGKGVALRAAGLGARVIVTEIDPVKACEAMMEGFDVMKMEEAAAHGDIFVTLTGCKDVITTKHYYKMKDGAVLCNAGHFDVEINIPALLDLSAEKYISRNNIESFVLTDDRKIHVLAQGRLVNLAAGDGHPAEIMDMSFALQAKAAQYISVHGKSMQNQVYKLPESIDDAVAMTLMIHKHRGLDVLTPDQQYYMNNWDLSST